jgi:hypothetical protein
MVGAPFRVVIAVRAPRGLTVQFPPGPDSGGAIESLDPRSVEASHGDSAFTELTATYRLAAWDVGRQSIALGNLVTRGPDGARPVALGDLAVFVASTLPASSAARQPKPARPVFDDRVPWWKRWEVGVAALVALASIWLLLRYWRRRRRRPRLAPAGPLAVAQREIADLERLALIDAGECGRHVALLAEIVRTYLARRLGHASLADTTTELMAELRGDSRVPEERLSAFLTETDRVKFARYAMPIDRARALDGEAKALIADVERATDAASAAAAAEVAAARAARRARRAAGGAGHAA